MALTPVGHRILIEADPIETQTESGIVIQYESLKREQGGQIFGTVIAVSKDAYNWTQTKEQWVNPGDRVAYARYAGKFIEDPADGKEYYIINDEDIIAIVS